MKYIKQYEDKQYDDIKNPLKIGVYVLCESSPDDDDIDNTLREYMKNHIGYIIGHHMHKNNKLLYHVKYIGLTKHNYENDYSLKDGTDDTILVWSDEIKNWSKDKEDLEVILSANKYNL
jgi:hypothetical protein